MRTRELTIHFILSAKDCTNHKGMEDRTLAKNMFFSKRRDVTFNLREIKILLKGKKRKKKSLLNPICKMKKVAKIVSIGWNTFLFSSV